MKEANNSRDIKSAFFSQTQQSNHYFKHSHYISLLATIEQIILTHLTCKGQTKKKGTHCETVTRKRKNRKPNNFSRHRSNKFLD